MHSNKGTDNDSDEGTLTSSDDEKYSDQSLSEHDDNDSDVDNSETESYRSLMFSVQSNRSTATIKSKKTKKRVQFKPGDSLVLVYIIPNREMLGLKSDSEDSDDSGDGSDSDDEDDDDDDDTSDDDSDDEKDNSDDEDNIVSKKKNNKPKPFGRLMSIQQVTKHKKSEQKNSVNSNTRPARDKTPKLINLNINSISKPPRRGSRASRKRERREKAKLYKKENTVSDNKSKSKSKRVKSNAITVDFDRMKRPRRSKPGILAIKATVKGDDKNSTTASVPTKLVYKHDLKPSVINVNGALNVSQTKLLQRSKLQPVSLNVSKGNNRPNSSSSANIERQTNVRHVVSTSYDSLTSLMPDSYNGFRHSLATDTLRALESDAQSDKDIFERLDPGNMTARSKRHYAWQVANGNISSQSLRTPSILPFWDSLKDTVPGNNSVKYPT